MAVSVATGSFNTGTGAVSSTTAVGSLGFQPLAILLAWNGRTEAVDTVGTANNQLGYGIATAAGGFSVTMLSENGGTSAVGANYHNADNCICTVNNAGAVSGLMALQSFDAGGFTLVVNDVMPADFRVMYWAFGGSDITNVASGTHLLASGTTGNVSVTGLAFQPEFGIFIAGNLTGAPPSGLATRSTIMIGAAKSDTKQFVLAGGADDASATMDTGAYLYDDECYAMQDANTLTSAVDRATFVSWNSDGYTVNVLEKAAEQRRIFYLVFKGGSWDISGIQTQTDTTTAITISGLSFAPKAGGVFSASRAVSTQDTPTTHHQGSVGFFTSASNRVAQIVLDEHGTANAEVTTAIEFDAVYGNISTASAIQGLMDVQSMDSGGVTFIMDDADPSQSFCSVITVGDTAGAAASRPSVILEPYPYMQSAARQRANL